MEYTNSDITAIYTIDGKYLNMDIFTRVRGNIRIRNLLIDNAPPDYNEDLNYNLSRFSQNYKDFIIYLIILICILELLYIFNMK